MSDRRDFMKAASAVLTTSIFTGAVRGANDRIQAGFIGVGVMGTGNLRAAMQQENLEPVAVCDVYAPTLAKAVQTSGGKARPVKDFREILADKSIDVVCISTPDHWHAYMTVEACKAGKDVYVEKPCSVTIEEGKQMVQAARKYNRVVQAGTMQRSQAHFQKAVEIVKSGVLGDIRFTRTWNSSTVKPEGVGNVPDSEPPKDLDWDMWLGPAQKRPFNANRWGVSPTRWSTFRYFWDYAGGWVTDWMVHLQDIVHFAMNEPLPVASVCLGQKLYTQDNAETPDVQVITLEYPQFIAMYEFRNTSSYSPLNMGYGILICGTKGTLLADRSMFKIIPERGTTLDPQEMRATGAGNKEHWANFLACVKSREKPVSDIETNHRTAAACHLGNIAYRAKCRVDFDPQRETIVTNEAKKFQSREQRKPWVIKV